MKLRVPTLGEILALFFTPTSVSGAVASLERAAQKVETVIAHQNKKADEHLRLEAAFMAEAADRRERAMKAQAEADRAIRVSYNLQKLVA